jgi:taurine dioxygenase
MLGYSFKNINLQNISEVDFSEIRQAIPAHGVICIKNQSLSIPDLVAFTKKIGQAVLLPEGLRFNNIEKEYPEIARVSNIKPDGTLLPNHGAAEYWHSDGDFWQNPKNYLFNLLYSEIVPQQGGETGFVDLRMAYESLSDEFKNLISEQEVIVSCKDIPDFKDARPEEIQPDAKHKITHLHPETKRKGLYFGHSFATISGLPSAISEAIVKELVNTINKPAFQYTHKYEKGDLLIWDNTSVMHKSMGGYGNNPRLLFRSQAFVKSL